MYLTNVATYEIEHMFFWFASKVNTDSTTSTCKIDKKNCSEEYIQVLALIIILTIGACPIDLMCL